MATNFAHQEQCKAKPSAAAFDAAKYAITSNLIAKLK